MRRPLALTAVLGVAVVAAAAALDEREVAFATGLPAEIVAAQLQAGDRACTGAIEVVAAFQRLRLVVGTEGRPGPSLRVAVTDAAGGRRLGAGMADGGYPDGANVELAVGDVPAGRRVRVCVTHTGGFPVRLFGSHPDRDKDLQPVPAVVFVRESPPSMLALVGDALDRSALFKPGFYGTWTAWLLLAVAAMAVPFALGRALSAAYASNRSYSRDAAESAASERST